MKISKELLQKYALGTCTEQERQAVELWLNSGGKFPKTKYERLFEPRKEIVRQKLYQRLWHNYKGLGRTTKKIIRLSVAACVLFGAFLGGRVSANTNAPVPVPATKFQEHMYISGGKGSQGNLYGERFKVKFEGTLRLYNASSEKQMLSVGDSTFVLVPGLTYYLSGTTDSATLAEQGYYMANDQNEYTTDGNYSIVRLYDQ